MISPHGGFACQGSTAQLVGGRGFCASVRFIHLERSSFFGGGDPEGSAQQYKLS
jgi:hypothetical protein